MTNKQIICRSNDISGPENFPMGCAFSPDGTCLLTATATDGIFRLYDVPFQYLNNSCSCKVGEDEFGEKGDKDENHSTENPVTDDVTTLTYSYNQNNQDTQQRHSWKASLTSHQGGPPPSASSASYAWYPLMQSTSPLTSLYVTCRGNSMPIHLIDAYTSQLRASYCPHNSVDELEGPTVVEFSPDGSRIYGTGFKSDRTIAVFDTANPGREGRIMRLGKTRRSSDGQKGIPSAMAFAKSTGGNSNNGPSNVFALGTYSPGSIYIYDDRMATECNPAGTIVLHGGLAVVGHGRAFARKKRRFDHKSSSRDDDGEENLFSSARVNWFQSRARGGITQLMWAPPTSNNPYVLYSASRRSNAVLSWDVRALSGQDLDGDTSKSSKRSVGSHTICGLQSYARDGDTNQRLEFDLDTKGKRLFVGSGSSEGVVKVYDASTGKLDDELKVVCEGSDAINGVSYTPNPFGNNDGEGLLAIAVGSRHFYEEDLSDNEIEIDNVSRNPGFLQLHGLGC
jgi:WD40 repeat protein